MKIKIVFNEDKALSNGHSLEELYEITDNICTKRNLSIIDKGYYKGTITVSQLFLTTDDMEQVEGLVDSADEWYWWIQSDNDADREDILEARTRLIKLGKGHLLNA